jgi:glutathione synthase/RimK-type ligase-like ATP-grasp enzyme
MVQDLLFSCKNNGISVTYKGKELHEIYSAIHIRNQGKFTDYANALRLYSNHYGLAIVNEKDVTLPYFGKVSQGFLFTINKIPTPSLASSPGNKTLLEHVGRVAEYPIIIKHNDGIKGLHNYLVNNVEELKTVLSQPLQGFVAQPFIKNIGELRVLTFGDDVKPFIFRKFATADSHLNNTSRGGSAEQIDAAVVNPEHLKHALKAAELTNREIGGVDVLIAKDGKHYILEVNSTPAIASGVFADEKIARYSEYFADKLSTDIEEEEE